MEWQTRNGLAIPTSEVSLPESRLNLSRPESFNTHHTAWTKAKMGQFLITQTLRDLEGTQELLPRDVHTWLHQNYDPPQFPTIQQAMDRVVMGYETGENLRILAPSKRAYILKGMTAHLMKQINLEYNELAGC